MSILYQPITAFLSREGKRLRPKLCTLCTQLFGGTPEQATCISNAIEMFHNFTLIHDDIEDNSLLRRGIPCLHITYGIPRAINMGDTLFALAIEEILSAPYHDHEKITLLSMLNQNFIKVFEGQATELAWHHNKRWDIQETDYLAMIEKKTGALLACACKAGAYIGGATPEQQETLYAFGSSLGIAFQIQDDILNLIGKEETYKKEIGGDITEGKRSLSVLHMLNNDHVPLKDKQTLKTILDSNTQNKEEISWCITQLKQSGALCYAQEKSTSIISTTLETLKKNIPASSARNELISLANRLLTRET